MDADPMMQQIKDSVNIGDMYYGWGQYFVILEKLQNTVKYFSLTDKQIVLATWWDLSSYHCKKVA